MSQHRPSEFPASLPVENDADLLRNPADELLKRGFIQLNTHDVSFVDEHIAGIEKFADDLQGAINAVWPTRNNSRYSGVHVLLMSWEDDNLGVEVEIRRLGHVFSNLYRFAVDEFKIPRKTPGKATTSRITSFLEKDGEENLLVVYYAGHSRPSRLANEAPIWVANNSSKSPSLPSGGVQQLLEEAESDVLLLFDSCHSTHPAINVSGQGVTEVIAACGFETQAPSVGQHSFTNALIQELEELFTGPPFSVAELHGRIIGNLKNWRPGLLRDSQGDIWTDQNGHPKYECHKRRTPVHCFLTNEVPYRSIMITPLPAELSRAAIGEMEDMMSPGSECTGDSSRQATSTESCDPTAFTPPSNPSEYSEPIKSPQVLLAVRLEDDYFLDGDEEEDRQKVKKWCQWLRNIPNGARDIKIEGVYRSCSTLVLMSMPVTIWDGIPANPAYSFVGFVNSTNLAPSNPEENTLLTINDAVASSPGNELNVKDSTQNIDTPTESRHKASPIDARPEHPPEYHREAPVSPNNDRITNAPCSNSYRDLKSSIFDIERFLKDSYQIKLKPPTDLTLEQTASIWASKMPDFTQSEKWQAPIKFTDAIGRKFILPFNLVRTWAGMELILKRAFEHMEIIGPHVADGLYDLVTPSGQIILPSSWESVIQPGSTIRMHIWSILPPLGPEKRQNPPVRFNYVSSKLDAQPDPSMNVEHPPSPPASPQPAQGGFAQFREKIRNMNERGKEKKEPRSMSRHRKSRTPGALKLHDVGGLLK